MTNVESNRGLPGWVPLVLWALVGVVFYFVRSIDDGASAALQWPDAPPLPTASTDALLADLGLIAAIVGAILASLLWLAGRSYHTGPGQGDISKQIRSLVVITAVYALADAAENALSYAAVTDISSWNAIRNWLWAVALVKWLLLAIAVGGAAGLAILHGFRQPKGPSDLVLGEPRQLSANAGLEGVCLSGGGIRSAAYSMGALQGMMVHMEARWKKVGLISAVSGGSYTAAARAIVQTESDPQELLVATGRASSPDPFAEGSAEWMHLLRRTDYLAPGTRGKAQLLNRWLRGLLWNVVFLGALIFTIARVVGWGVGAYRVDYAVDAGLASGVILLGVTLSIASVPQLFRMSDFNRRVWYGAADMVVGALVATVVVLVFLPSWDTITDFMSDLWSSMGTATLAQPLVTSALVVGIVTAIWRALILPYATRFASVLAGLLVPIGAVALFGAIGFTGTGGPNQTSSFFSLTAPDFWFVVGSLLLVAIIGLADAQIWSPHQYYKTRLSDAFAVKRVGGEAVGLDSTDLKTYADMALETPPQVSNPELLICATANISGGDVVTGHRAASWVFGHEDVGIRGWLDVQDEMVDVQRMANRLGGRREEDFTLAAAMAVSGAAISPSMGRLTRRNLQALMAVLNVRLGVWYPNPAADEDQIRVPRVWTHLLREILGLHSLSHHSVYVTDGGHFDNLGLVELIRHGCQQIYCFDGGGDRPGEYDSLATAIQIAETQLGVRITGLNPHETMALDEVRNTREGPVGRVSSRLRSVPWRLIKSDWIRGKVLYPDNTDGDIWYARLGLVRQAPFELLEYQRQNPPFPYHSTALQLFSSDRFEAYRKVGLYAAKGIADGVANNYNSRP